MKNSTRNELIALLAFFLCIFAIYAISETWMQVMNNKVDITICPICGK